MINLTPLVLPIHPWPVSDERMALLREAKERIDTPVKILPARAAYGSPGRVLCFGEVPSFLTKTIPIRPENVDNIDSIEAALRAWLDPWFPEDRYAEEFLLGYWMGADVKQVGVEDEFGVRFE